MEELLLANAQLQQQLEQAQAALAMQREEAAAALAEHRREAARALAAAVEVARAEERLAVLAAVARDAEEQRRAEARAAEERRLHGEQQRMELHMQSPCSVYQHMLRHIPADVSVEASLLGPQGLHHVLETSVPPMPVGQLRALISNHRRLTDAIPSGGASSDAKLMIRLYTLKSPIYTALNRPLMLPRGRRGVGALNNTQHALRMMLRAFQELAAVEQYRFTGTLYRGVTIANNPDYQRKYDNYGEDYAVGKLVTFGPFLSCSMHDGVAASPEFHDCLLFQFINVRGVSISHLSEYAGEQEVLIAPPSVFRVVARMHVQGRGGHYDEQQQQWVGGLVMITLEQVLDTPLTYL